MTCGICGADLKKVITDLPFKLTERSIVILRDLPVLQCQKCSDYLLEDPVMDQVEQMLKSIHRGAELEIIRFAA
jgi:YgiT-type zinc finger domain-containing protein